MDRSPCGIDCSACHEYKSGCPGCRNLEGRIYWTDKAQDGPCRIYLCATRQRGYHSCGECPELPCHRYASLREEKLTPNDPVHDISARVDYLTRGR
ncbi:MAG: DUF3795 domain-containing protein [Planctomycetes bacterium]|nr:DUF3795 domain-containing protein [Planctomycetota bacterium]